MTGVEGRVCEVRGGYAVCVVTVLVSVVVSAHQGTTGYNKAMQYPKGET